MSNETVEPLALLRDYLSRGRKVTLVDKKLLQFDDFENQPIRLPLNTPTAWRKGTSDGGFFSLGSLWCSVTSQHLKPSAVMRQASELGLDFIGIGEQKEIIRYFTLSSSETQLIDIQRRQKTLLNKNELKFGRSSKRPQKMEKKRDVKLNEKLEVK